ncbi:MAG: hypothetical protein JWM82_2612, partial [Myxococcales bacterium]|nr:hypothetical protein [Myxococcales bacterium]
MEDRTSLRSATTLLVPLALSLLSACTGK